MQDTNVFRSSAASSAAYDEGLKPLPVLLFVLSISTGATLLNGHNQNHSDSVTGVGHDYWAQTMNPTVPGCDSLNPSAPNEVLPCA